MKSGRFLTRRANWLALALVAVFIAVALAAPVLAPPEDPLNPAPFKVVGPEQDKRIC